MLLLLSDLAVLLIQNALFSYALGCPDLFTACRQHRFGLMPHGGLVLLLSTLCSGAARAVMLLIPQPYCVYLIPLCTVLTAGIADLLMLLLLSAVSMRFARKAAPLLHGAAFSSAALGLTLLAQTRSYDLTGAFRYGLRWGIGYLAVCLLLQMAMPALDSERMPESVRGWRGLFVLTGLLSLAAACFRV